MAAIRADGFDGLAMKKSFWRTAPALAPFLLFIGFALLRGLAPDFYFAVLSHAGFTPTKPPMGDMRSVLQALYCSHSGVNVYAPSACLGGGIYNYSPFLLHFALLPQPPRDGIAAGVGMGILFLASLCLLPVAQTRAELVLRVLASCSANVAFVMERGNIDAGMFVLAVLGICVIRAKNIGGIAGYALFLLGAACKFYPAALLLLALREQPRRLLLLVGLGLFAAAFYALKFGSGSLVALRVLPAGLPFHGLFGALNLPFGVWMFATTHSMFPASAPFLAAFSYPGLGLCMQIFVEVMALIMLVLALRVAPRWASAFEGLAEQHRLFLVGGAAIMVLCFFLAQNIPYRAIFLLLALPGLCRMAAAGVPWMRTACVAILYLLWQDAIQDALHGFMAGWPVHLAETLNFTVWLAGQFVWWSCIFMFMGMIICFLKQRVRVLWPRAVAAAA